MKSIFKLCAPYLRRHSGRIAILIGLYILANVTTVIAPYISGSFIDELTQTKDAGFIKIYVLALVLIAAFEFVLGYVCERLYIRVQVGGGYELNADAIHHVQNITFRFMQGKNTAFLNQQINNDSNMLIIFCITVLQNIISNVITLVLPLVLLYMFEPWLAVAMIVIDLAYFGLYNVFKEPVYKADYEFMKEQAEYFSKLDAQLNNVNFIKAQGISDGYIKRLDRSVKTLLGKCLKSQKAEYGFSGSDVVIRTAANVVVFVLGGMAVIADKMTIGELTMVMSYFGMSLGATQYFFSLGKSIQSNKVSCDRLEKIFEIPEQTNGSITLSDIESIECNGVSFGYDDEPIFENRSVTLEKGKLYAFVGENGAGKSTFINLLLGMFIDEYSGKVLYNGIPMESIDMRRLRRELVGISEQEPMLIEETLRFNLTLDESREPDEKEFRRLAHMLDLDDFLSFLPDGIDTVINEGSTNLSGGEKQKLSIIRALLKKPKLLVLDEPTSALDVQSRRSLINYLKGRQKDMIVVISTHDSELLEVCDEVVRMEGRAAPKIA
ncbi:MAG: ABC transporter ATP-binding protein [Clostridia bacterium]|nr:ABC transporter ATP-binding protein [Clostridia bacterium]